MDEREPLLEIRGLCAGYGGREVIRDLSLTVQAGETAALLGLNGSGKSTLLRAALGLTSAQGSVTADGRDVWKMTQRQRAGCVGYIPQSSRMDEGMTALEAVLMGANAQTPLFAGYSRSQKVRAMDCLARLDIDDLAQRMIGTLSQGQRQSVVFARAMMQQPQIYLLDEPDGALDLPRRYAMMARVREMTKERRCCALIALHDASLALNRCDWVLILQGGVIACGLDMRSAKEEEVRAAMRLLYGDVKTDRVQGGWAVTG